MTATTQLRIVVPTEARPSRAPVIPDEQVINLTIECDEKLLLSVVEAAHRLGVGRTLMYELLDSGQIESMHVGRLHKVPAEALTAFVERPAARSSRAVRFDLGGIARAPSNWLHPSARPLPGSVSAASSFTNCSTRER